MAMKANKQPIKQTVPIEEPKEEKVSLTHAQLLEALYFCWDAFERSTLNLFLVKDTAHQIIAGGDLSGDGLTLGIRRMEWNGGQQRILSDFLDHEGIFVDDLGNGNLAFKFKEVPIFLKVYEDNPCIESLDTVFYGYETFLTPNPFKTFEEQYDK